MNRLLRGGLIGVGSLVGALAFGEVLIAAGRDAPHLQALGAVLELASPLIALAAGALGAIGVAASAGRIVVGGVAVGGLALGAASFAYGGAMSDREAAIEGCWFRFEVRMLKTAIPERVGDCLENARSDPRTGDALQRTTGGLLVWRRSDRRAAFTDGARTWVEGPGGVESRANDERFPWEPELPTATPPPAATTAPAGTAAQPTATPRPVVVSTPQTAAAGPAPSPTVAAAQKPTAPAPALAAATKPAAAGSAAVDFLADAVLLNALRTSGLPLSGIDALTPGRDSEALLGRAGGPVSKVVFRDTRAPGLEQSIEMYADASSASARVAALSGPAAKQHAFTSAGSKVVLRVSKELSPEALRSYEAWLKTLR